MNFWQKIMIFRSHNMNINSRNNFIYNFHIYNHISNFKLVYSSDRTCLTKFFNDIWHWYIFYCSNIIVISLSESMFSNDSDFKAWINNSLSSILISYRYYLLFPFITWIKPDAFIFDGFACGLNFAIPFLSSSKFSYKYNTFSSSVWIG